MVCQLSLKMISMSMKMIMISYAIIMARISLNCSASKLFSTPQMVGSYSLTHTVNTQ